MSTSNHENRPTSILITASNILQALSPSRLGLLVVIHDNDIQTQGDIADLIGRPQSTISSYLQSLGGLTPPLTGKRGKYYIVTSTGKQVISLVNDLSRRCDHKLRSTTWDNETDRDTVDAFLTPLHDSQVIRPYLILDSLHERSGIDGPLGTPEPVRFDDIVRDVESRYDDLEKSTTTEEIRRTVKLRFNDTDAARFEGGKVTLLHKGHQHACLWNELIQYLKKQDRVDSGRDTGIAITDTETTTGNLDDYIASPSIPGRESGRSDGPQNTPQQIVSEGSREGRQSAIEQNDISEHPSIIPVYTLHSSADTEKEWSGPILPLTARMTIEELAASVNQLATEYNGETELVLDWMVQTESGLYPLASTSSDISGMLELQHR